MNIHNTYEACVDCVMFLANGDLPEDREDLAEDMVRTMGAESLRHASVTGEEWGHGYNEFSARSCECCGSRLGGARYEVTVLCNHPECAEGAPL